LGRLAVLFVSFDSATRSVRSTVATYVPMAHAPQLNVTLAPAARFGTVNCRFTTEIVRIDVEPEAAFPPFLMTIVFFVKEATYRSGRGGGGGGGGATIDQPKLAGGPTLPAASRPRAAKECVPTPSDWYEAGLTQPVNVPPSSEHSKATSGSLALNAKLALVSVVEAGGVEVSVTVGEVVSGGTYRHWTLAGLPTFPALSVARTEKRWSPAASPEKTAGVVQGE
jgi:hypothetical protein